jgi:hypothetical protein
MAMSEPEIRWSLVIEKDENGMPVPSELLLDLERGNSDGSMPPGSAQAGDPLDGL